MTFYEQKLSRLKQNLYKNQGQIDGVIAIKHYIDAHYESDLNLQILSKTQFISKFHLLRLFKKYYGLTPKQYLIDIRIEQAKKHLQNNKNVTETCIAVGFESLGSFSVLFKNKTGKSPYEFRKEQLSRSNIVDNH